MNIRYPIYEGVYRILTDNGGIGGSERVFGLHVTFTDDRDNGRGYSPGSGF